jgi:hypothetical protein
VDIEDMTAGSTTAEAVVGCMTGTGMFWYFDDGGS